MSAFAEVQNKNATTRLLGKIPVRNLWLLMLYASDLYRHIGSKKIDVEDNLEDIADLVAEILCHQVKERMMRNLSYEYQSNVAVMSRVRGRIDLLITKRQSLLEKGKICCRFDELTVDTPRNRYVRAALERLTKLNIKATLAHKCRSLALSLERLGVNKAKPVNYSGKTERFGRHDMGDQKMIAAADLAFSLALPTEFDGQFHLTSPDTQKEWLRKLFEKAIRGFYIMTSDNQFSVHHCNKELKWQIDSRPENALNILPKMYADIVIHNVKTNQTLIIDTKFNEITTQDTRFDQDKAKLRNQYIYQIYTYLRSQENTQDMNSQTSIGMLLHPTIDKEVTEMAVIQGHPIWFCTVNLGESANNIRSRLFDLLDKTLNV